MILIKPIITGLLILFLAISCNRGTIQKSTPGEEQKPANAPFDPLATAADREVVPEVYPAEPSVSRKAGDTLMPPGGMAFGQYDSTVSTVSPTEVYRVQIFTSRLYAEAKREQALADEIFNLPVHLDYEVPYYKLRVGDFQTRGEAEDMVSEIKAIGYRNAWVARVILRVHEAPEFDTLDQPILPADSGIYIPAPSDSTSPSGGGDDN